MCGVFNREFANSFFRVMVHQDSSYCSLPRADQLSRFVRSTVSSCFKKKSMALPKELQAKGAQVWRNHFTRSFDFFVENKTAKMWIKAGKYEVQIAHWRFPAVVTHSWRFLSSPGNLKFSLGWTSAFGATSNWWWWWRLWGGSGGWCDDDDGKQYRKMKFEHD